MIGATFYFLRYAAVGLIGGMTGVSNNFCHFVFHGSANLCANATNLVTLAWRFVDSQT